MKYLKTFENSYQKDIDVKIYISNKEKSLSDINDYVYVNVSNYENIHNLEFDEDNIHIGKIGDYSTDENYPYIIILQDGGDFWAAEDEIMDIIPTQDEIEKFEMVLQTNKYNL